MWDVVVRREVRPLIDALAGGVHLKNGYRLAFSMQPAEDDDCEGRVLVLYVGTRDTRDRSGDVWRIVHELFGAENPSSRHLRPPCCEQGLPALDQSELDDFMRRLRHLLRGR